MQGFPRRVNDSRRLLEGEESATQQRLAAELEERGVPHTFVRVQSGYYGLRCPAPLLPLPRPWPPLPSTSICFSACLPTGASERVYPRSTVLRGVPASSLLCVHQLLRRGPVCCAERNRVAPAPGMPRRSLEERRAILGAASVRQLCKSMVMVNTKAPPGSHRQFLVIVQVHPPPNTPPPTPSGRLVLPGQCARRSSLRSSVDRLNESELSCNMAANYAEKTPYSLRV